MCNEENLSRLIDSGKALNNQNILLKYDVYSLEAK